MNVINRGAVGSWRKGGSKALFGVLYVAMGIGLVALAAWGFANNAQGTGAVGVFILMWILALGDALEDIYITLSWVFDDEEVAHAGTGTH
jgi:hypothetical protein